MRLQFRCQQFQSDAATAVCDMFAGQTLHVPTCLLEGKGVRKWQLQIQRLLSHAIFIEYGKL